MNGNYYCPHMQKGNVFVVCVSVRAVTFGADGIETLFSIVVDEYRI